ncbi:amidohydrolase [Pulveribacter suum]|uniref:Amidohydrolase n=1 Tax=Pulveribacter suum TaxID=2116657 RepID=A0A2P1NI36_9BURK|nr:amidohydrolase [Pulveribacter suum]AVP56734.1 amidohydrolase [Pulveribacter suum]
MKQRIVALAATSLFTAMVAGCASPGAPQGAADSIYMGGPILTMNDAQPNAEAVAVQGGRITAVGSRADVMKLQGPATRVVDLKGKTLLPGFVDPHSHLSVVGLQAVSANMLPSPDGNNDSVAQLQENLRRHMQTSPEARELGIVLGFGYDDSQLKEQRHPTREELDAISTTVPVMIIHQSSHFGVLNSVALRQAGISAATPNPQGGVIGRKTGSQEPNGLLEENAFFGAAMRLMPKLTEAQASGWLAKAQALYLQYGYTTVQDGRSSPDNVAQTIRASKAGVFKIDVVSYPDILELGDGSMMQSPYYSRDYTQHFRIGGVKMTLDGSPQGKTAWLSQPYYKAPEGKPADYAGYGVLTSDKANELMTQAFSKGWQVIAHANGDAAIDQLIGAVRVAQQRVPAAQDSRPVLIHGQTLRKDQVAQLDTLGIFPSLYPMHTFYWGDWHRDSVLGPQRAENISPTGWVLARGMRFTSHHDAPVAFPSSIRVLDATVNRTTRTGKVLGAEHRVDPATALKSLTLWAAYQHFEEGRKGSIEKGKLADFVVLSDNPVTMPRQQLSTLQVLETIKEDTSVYRAK